VHHLNDGSLLLRAQLGPAAPDPPVRPGRHEPGLRALADHRPLELRKAAHHLHQHAARGRGRVNGFGQAAETGVRLGDALHQMEEIFERARQPIQCPHDHDVPRPLLIEPPVELRTILVPPRGALGKQPFDSSGMQGSLLHVGILLVPG
jgi:hypothetical protein